jgi:negative regulator of sigma E activity
VNDASRRSVRTLLQIGVVEGVLQLLTAFGLQLTEEQHAAILVVATPLVTALQCWLEDNSNMPAILKAPASEGQNPTPADGGTP